MEGCKLTTKLLSQEGSNKYPYWEKMKGEEDKC